MPRKVIQHATLPPMMPLSVDIEQYISVDTATKITALSFVLSVVHKIPSGQERPYIKLSSNALGAILKVPADQAPGIADGEYYFKDKKIKTVIDAVEKISPGFSAFCAKMENTITAPLTEISTVLQHRNLDDENYASWLAMLNLDPSLSATWNTVKPILRAISSKLASDAPVSQWAAYHLRATSTVSLVKKFIEDALPLASVACAQVNYDLKIVARLDDEVLDHGIPEILIANAVCYFDACDYKYGDWFQGKKAINKMPGPFRKGRTELYKRYLEVTNMFGNLSNIKTADEIVGLLTGATNASALERRAVAAESAERIDAALIKAIARATIEAAGGDEMSKRMADVAQTRAGKLVQDLNA